MPGIWRALFSLYRNADHSCWNLGFLFLVFWQNWILTVAKELWWSISCISLSLDMVMFCCAAIDCSLRDSSLRNWWPWSWVGKYVRPCRDYENCNEGLGVHSSNGLVTTFNGNDVDGTITETRILQFLSYSGNKDNLKTQTIFFWQKFPDRKVQTLKEVRTS